MRFHEFTDPSGCVPSKTEAAKTAEHIERNPPRYIEDDAPRHETASVSSYIGGAHRRVNHRTGHISASQL
jgi:hypothetical protein